MSKSNLSGKAIMLIVIVFVLIGYSCEKTMTRDENPPWLGGSNIETLEKRTKEGNKSYDIFLELMDSAGYRDAITKQLFTLFVPDDDAFRAFFQQEGINSIADLSKDEALMLFSQHALENPRSRYHLIYEYMWAEEQGPLGEYASYFFRKPTKSESIPYKEVVKYNETYKDKELLIYTGKKLLPIFSSDFFEDFFGALDGSDYEFMYRKTKWPKTGLCWHNAAVIEQEVRTANGFINFVDQVVPIAPNLDEYLSRNQDKYGLFWDIAQRFANYGTPKNDKQKRLMYLKTYDMIFNIANEEGPFGGNENSRKGIYTLYCPNDKALKEYLDRTILKFYPSLDSVPKITLYYVIQPHILQSLGLISKIKVNFWNSFGDPTILQESDFNDAFVCSNGVFYEMNKVLEPYAFASVPGRLFFDPNYSTFLYCVDKAAMLSSISNPRINVTVFAPTNEQLEAHNIRYNTTKDIIETAGTDGVWTEIKSETLVDFVRDHIHIGVIPDLSGEGFIEMDSKNFAYYKNNKIISGGNQALGETSSVLESLPNDKNGHLYTIDKPIKANYKIGQLLTKTPEYSKFADLLIQANLLDINYVDETTKDTIPNLKFFADAAYWTAFIPDNKAIEAAEVKGQIPTEMAELSDFLMYHFIKGKTVFDDGNVSGKLETNRITEVSTIDGIIYSTLDIANSPNSLSVTDHSGQKVNIDHKNANQLVSKGVAHKITSVLIY